MDRKPGLSVRFKLTLSYAGFLMLAGVVLLAVVWVFLLRYVPDGRALRSLHGPNRSDLLRAFARKWPQRWRSCSCSGSLEDGSSLAACSPR